VAIFFTFAVAAYSWLLIGVFAGIVEIVPVVAPPSAGVLAIGAGLTDSWETALGAGIAV
jgi:predicted PurR-regulated permease PerM